MTIYNCTRCGYTINIKQKYINHLKRKNLCKNILSNDDLLEEYKKYNIIKSDIVHQISQNEPKMSQNEPKSDINLYKIF